MGRFQTGKREAAVGERGDRVDPRRPFDQRRQDAVRRQTAIVRNRQAPMKIATCDLDDPAALIAAVGRCLFDVINRRHPA